MHQSTFPTKSLTVTRQKGRIVNAMSVDVEDYFQVQALASVFDRPSWEKQESRIERNVQTILDLFEGHGVKATFFSLAWIAERHKDMIRRIVAGGHELGSHGSEHRRADEQTPDLFRQDVRHSKRLLEDIGGVAVRGYRAPTFSIGANNLWAFDILAEEGYAFSSSVYPVQRDFYGMPSAPRFAFYPRLPHPVEEYPITTVRIGPRNLPCGGGGFFRLLPYPVSRWAIAHVNRHDQRPAIFYFHPWEVDPDQPRVNNVPFKARFRHYLNLDKTRTRLNRLLTDFAWDRMDRVFHTGSSNGTEPSCR